MNFSRLVILLFALCFWGVFFFAVNFLGKIIYQVKPAEQVTNNQSINPAGSGQALRYSAQKRPSLAVGGGGNSLANQQAKPQITDAYLARLWQKRDIERGKRLFRQCLLCHNISQDQRNGTGPNLYGLFTRPLAGVKSFPYSQAMKNFAKQQPFWDRASLFLFLSRPKEVIRGTSMQFFGIAKEQDRIDLIGYLEQLDTAR